jgi:Lamin Tail Domain
MKLNSSRVRSPGVGGRMAPALDLRGSPRAAPVSTAAMNALAPVSATHGAVETKSGTARRPASNGVRINLRILNALLLASLLAGGCTSESDPLLISEFMASNSTTLKDADGESSDWIEVFNPGSAPIDLEGWRLTDAADEPGWAFPKRVLAPGEYLVVFASAKQPGPAETELHVNFKLKATPDFLALMRRSGRVVQHFAPYPEQFGDVSYGVGANGVTGYLDAPTPGAANGAADKKRKEKPREAKPQGADDD